jgi:hypothetical protein
MMVGYSWHSDEPIVGKLELLEQLLEEPRLDLMVEPKLDTSLMVGRMELVE